MCAQTGRMGASIPADSIIATIVSAIGTMSLPLLPAFMSRFGRRTLRRYGGLSSCVLSPRMAHCSELSCLLFWTLLFTVVNAQVYRCDGRSERRADGHIREDGSL